MLNSPIFRPTMAAGRVCSVANISLLYIKRCFYIFLVPSSLAFLTFAAVHPELLCRPINPMPPLENPKIHVEHHYYSHLCLSLIFPHDSSTGFLWTLVSEWEGFWKPSILLLADISCPWIKMVSFWSFWQSWSMTTWMLNPLLNTDDIMWTKGWNCSSLTLEVLPAGKNIFSI